MKEGTPVNRVKETEETEVVRAVWTREDDNKRTESRMCWGMKAV